MHIFPYAFLSRSREVRSLHTHATYWHKAHYDTDTTCPVINYLSLGFVKAQRKIYQMQRDDTKDSQCI